MNKLLIAVGLLLPVLSSAAIFQVTSVNDEIPDGCETQNCTLREAIIAANEHEGEDTILLNDSTYFLYLQGTTDDLAISGDLDVLDDLRIIGQFTSTEPLDVLTVLEAGQLTENVFEVHEDVSFYMEQVAVKNSDVAGTLGGVIKANNANINLNQVIFSQNKAREGGAIFSLFSELTINDSVFDNNEATSNGGAVFMAGGAILVNNSYFIKNQALSNGGAIYASFLAQQSQPTIQLDRTFIIENYAEDLGGGLFISGTENNPADVLINRSLIQNNEAQYGGGIRQEGSINTSIHASSFYSNRVAYHDNIQLAIGGAIMLTNGSTPFRPELKLSHSAFIENFAENDGGAILSTSGDVDLINVTFSGNQAQNHSTLVSYASTINLSHVTAYGNNATNGIDFLLDDSDLVTVNSLLVGQCLLDRRNTSSLGGNIESPGNTCGIGSGINDNYNVSPVLLLEPNIDLHGGPTPTHAIYSTSTALNNGIPINATSTDQRYMPRGPSPDTGAFERQAFENDLIYKNGYEF